MAIRKKTILVISVHGMLEKWSLNQNKLKKTFAWWVYQKRILKKASILIASSDIEYESIRAAGLKQPVAIIPNSIVPPMDQVKSSGALWLKGDESCKKRNLLYLSRIHPKKGLHNLISSLAQIETCGWHLIIVGEVERGYEKYKSELDCLVEKFEFKDKVEFLGDLRFKEKAEIFQKADLFVLPSYSENFGIVVAEALSYGVPVITTNQTPWSDLNKLKCGWCVEVGVQPLKEALIESMALDDEAFYEMGLRCKSLAKRFSTEIVRGKWVALYQWLIGNSARPDFIREY